MRKTFLVILVGLLSAVCAQAATVYTKVNTKPTNDWPGTYIIVYEQSATQALVWNGEDASSNYQQVTISNGKISSDDLADYQVTVTKEGNNKYYVKAKDGFIGCSAKSNDITFNSGGQACTIQSNGGYVMLETNTNTCRFVYNTNANRFRFYYDKDGNKWADSNYRNICFYVLGDVEQEDPDNLLDLGYAHAEMYACESKFPTQSNPYDQYFMTFLYLAQEESDEAVPQIGLEILAPTQYSIEGTYKSDYTPGQKYFLNCQAGSDHSSFIFPNKLYPRLGTGFYQTGYDDYHQSRTVLVPERICLSYQACLHRFEPEDLDVGQGYGRLCMVDRLQQNNQSCVEHGSGGVHPRVRQP